MMQIKQYRNENVQLQYYEIANDKTPLVLIHAQGVDATSYEKIAKKLARYFHIYAVDCYGHGGSLHDASQYHVEAIGDAILDWIHHEIGTKIWLLGHSSGGLIAAYIAAQSDCCLRLILEDPPLFASQGERRKSTFNYVDLSTICHRFLQQNVETDFVLYYFANQYAWNFFPDESREKIKAKLSANAAAYRRKHPDKNLKVLFWPKSALAAFQGMNQYDPKFGEAFYDDSFHHGIAHEDMLRKIQCKTIFMKAKTDINADGLLMAALNDEDVQRVAECIPDCEIVHFDCGHGIHTEQPKAFLEAVLNAR